MTVDIKRIGTNPLMESHLFSDTMYSINPEGTLRLLAQAAPQACTDPSLSYISDIYKEKMHELINSNVPIESFRIAVESENSMLLKCLLKKRRLPEIELRKVLDNITNPSAIQFMIDPANKVPLNDFYIKSRLVNSDDKAIIKAILTSPGAEKRFMILHLWSTTQKHFEVVEQNLEFFSFDQADTRFLAKAIDFGCFGIVQKIMKSKAVIKVDLNYREYNIQTDTLAYCVTKCLESGQQDLANRIQKVRKNRNMLCNKIYNAASSNISATAGICLQGIALLGGPTTGLLPSYAYNILCIAAAILMARN